MKILFVSDTHGNLDCINSLARKHGASYCFHAGDVCCFDRESIPFFSDLELRRMIEHSEFSGRINEKTSRGELERIAAEGGVYGDFHKYVTGEKRFDIPVFAVMGNREDLCVVAALRQDPIANFTVLDDHDPILIGGFAFFGIGGTFSEECLAQEPKAKGRIYPVISRRQLQRLAEAADAIPPEYKRVFITHMGPAEDPATQLPARRYAADYVFSGHTHHFSARDWYCRQEDAILELHDRYGWETAAPIPGRDRSLTLNFNLPKASRGYMIVATDGSGDDISFRYYNKES